jgi:hypothetical protein
MKTWLTITMTLAFATTVVCGQNLPTYQSILTGQSPYYYNTLDNTFAPSVGTGTLAPTSDWGGFTNDYFGNANNAAYFTNSTAKLADATGADEIYNSGSASVGSISFLFYTPNTNSNTTTRYIFSNGESSGNFQFFLKLAGTNVLVLGAGNKASITNSTTLQLGTWYYWAATWNFTGANSSTYGINWYLGEAGQPVGSLTSGFVQRGGSGNISSSSYIGNAGTFNISGQQAVVGGGYTVGSIPGMVDEFATWSNQLSVAQIDSQYDALIVVPEPASFALVGLGGLLLLFARRSFRSRRGMFR